MRRLVWHRKGDLRLHDNELYHDADDVTEIVSLFVIDPADHEPRPLTGSSKHLAVTEGPHASRALLDAVADLRLQLRTLGGDLLLRHGHPCRVVPEVARQVQANQVAWNRLPGFYERILSDRLERILTHQEERPWTVHTVASYTFYHLDDLPHGQEAWTRWARPKEKMSQKNNNKPNPTVDTRMGRQTTRWLGLPRILGDFRRAVRRAATERIQTFPILCGRDHPIDPGPLPTMKELTSAYRDKSLFGLSACTIESIIDAASIEQQSLGRNRRPRAVAGISTPPCRRGRSKFGGHLPSQIGTRHPRDCHSRAVAVTVTLCTY